VSSQRRPAWRHAPMKRAANAAQSVAGGASSTPVVGGPVLRQRRRPTLQRGCNLAQTLGGREAGERKTLHRLSTCIMHSTVQSVKRGSRDI